MRLTRTGLVSALLIAPAHLSAQVDASVPKPPNTAPAQDPAAAVLASVDIKLWGQVLALFNYDTFQGRGGVGGVDYQNHVTIEGRDQTSFQARDTRFGFRASETFGDWDASAVAELDFYGEDVGDAHNPRLRRGYVEVRNKRGLSVRLGQDEVPVACQEPDTLDFGKLATAGNLWGQVPQLTVRRVSGPWEQRLGFMHRRVASSQDQQERMPWVLARVARQAELFGEAASFALGGGYRGVTVNGRDYDAWLACLEFDLGLGRKLRLVGEAFWGQGLGREFVRPQLDYNGTLGREIGVRGGFAAAEYRISDELRVHLGYGLDDPDSADVAVGQVDEGGVALAFAQNQVGFAKLEYRLSERTGLGIEFMQLETEQLDGSSAQGQRFNLGCWFIF